MALKTGDVEPLLADRGSKRRTAAVPLAVIAPPPRLRPHWGIELLHGFAAEFRALGSGFAQHVWRIVFYSAIALALAYICSTWFTDARAAYDRDAFEKEGAQATYDKLDCKDTSSVTHLGKIGENSCVEASTIVGRLAWLHAGTTATQQLAARVNPCSGQCTMLFYTGAFVAALIAGMTIALAGVYFGIRWLHNYSQRQRQLIPTFTFPPDVGAVAAAKKAL